jgi:glycosyltransferase involved in cell wall biosynthesis
VAEVVINLATDQVRAGWEVFTACPPEGALAGRVSGAGAEFLSWPATRSPGRTVIDETRRLARLVEQVQPDLVHLHSAKAGLAGRLAVRGRRPTVFQPHAWSFDAVGGALYHASLAWERHAVRWTTRLLCVSEHERDRGRRRGIRGPAEVVPNGVDVDAFRALDEADRALARARLGLPPAATVICVGRLCRQKGQDLLVAAWPRVSAAVAGARLVLVGDGPDEALLRSIAPAGVTFAGHATDPKPWYAAADVVVLPSRWEGMPLVLLEAMASGRCVVATDVGGVREVLSGPGIAPVGDVPALATAIIARLRDPDGTAAQAARNRDRVVGGNNLGRLIKRTRDIYLEITGGVGDPPVASPVGAASTAPDRGAVSSAPDRGAVSSAPDRP